MAMDNHDELLERISIGLFEAVASSINGALADWEGNSPLDPLQFEANVAAMTMTTGAIMLMNTLGKDAAVMAVRHLADSMTNGELDRLLPIGSGSLQ